MVWYRVPVSEGSAKEEIQTSLLSHNGPGTMAVGNDKLVRYSRYWISGPEFIGAHQGYRLSEHGPDPRERGTRQFNFARAG